MATKTAKTLEDAVIEAVTYVQRLHTKKADGTLDSGSYNNSYSPNNIKTLVLSPNSSYVTLHKRVDVEPLRVTLNPTDIAQDMYRLSKKGTRNVLFNALEGKGYGKGRKTQNIESIVIFSKPDFVNNSMTQTFGGIQGNQKQETEQILRWAYANPSTYLNFLIDPAFLKGIQSGNSIGEPQILRVFKRIRFVAVLGVSEAEFTRQVGGLSFRNCIGSIKDVETFRQFLTKYRIPASFPYVNNKFDDTAIGVQPSTYSLDAEIKSYLEGIISNKDVVEDKNKDTSFDTDSEYKRLIHEFKGYNLLYRNLAGMIAKFDTIPILKDSDAEYKEIAEIELYDTKELKGIHDSVKGVKWLATDVDESVKIEKNIKNLKTYRQRLLGGLVNFLTESLIDLDKDPMNTYVVQVDLQSMNRVALLRGQSPELLALMQKYGVTPKTEGSKIDDCLANTFAYILQMLTNASGEITTKAYWVDKIKTLTRR